jgi:hypothetical protein
MRRIILTVLIISIFAMVSDHRWKPTEDHWLFDEINHTP